MIGKILKISSNDLYGNVDDRHVAVFAAFNHLRYMNKYVIFTFEGEFNKKKLYYGSLHLKDNSMVIFSVNEATKKFIDAFVDSYLRGNVDPREYSLIDISNTSKVELVSYNERDFDYLNELDRMSIARANADDNENTSGKRRGFLYFLLILMLALLGGISYLYFFPEKFTTEYNMLECQAELNNQQINMDYVIKKVFKFDKEDKIRSLSVLETYTFGNSNDYTEFKENHREREYFNINGDYQYDDDNLTLKLIYTENSIVDNFTELKSYMKSEGYKCQEGTYYE